MWAIYSKELNLFFSSLIGYIVMGVFLLTTSVFLWILPQFNIFEGGYATLNQFFLLAPYVFWFLIPALTMRTFAEERKAGTIEFLSSKPLTDVSIILGKYLASVTLVLISLLPTLLYYYSIVQLSTTNSDVDHGATIGSYIGLFFLGAVFTSMGIFASSLTDNQIVAFITSLLFCFGFYSLFDLLTDIDVFKNLDYLLTNLSLQQHYDSISRGIVDSRDLVFFISVIAFFLLSTHFRIQSRKW